MKMNLKDSTPTATGVTQERLAGLRRWNLGLALLHFAQAVAIVLLAGGFAITVTSSIPEGPPGTAVPAPRRSSRCRSAGPLPCSSPWPRSTTC
jgi:hypothetical protein